MASASARNVAVRLTARQDARDALQTNVSKNGTVVGVVKGPFGRGPRGSKTFYRWELFSLGPFEAPPFGKSGASGVARSHSAALASVTRAERKRG